MINFKLSIFSTLKKLRYLEKLFGNISSRNTFVLCVYKKTQRTAGFMYSTGATQRGCGFCLFKITANASSIILVHSQEGIGT